MDCCSSLSEKKSCCNELTNKKMKGGIRKMNKRVVMWTIIAALFVVALFLTFKAGSVSSGVQTVQTAGVAAKSSASSYSGMVGGC